MFKEKYWFPAKRYGWGWGIPSTWQGWVVLVGFLALLALGTALLATDGRIGGYIAYVTIISAVLIAVAWWKGEPPRWRWGE